MLFMRSQLFLVAFFAIENFTWSFGNELECSGEQSGSQKTSVWVKSKKKESGEWETSFFATKNTTLSSEEVGLNLTQAVVDCSGHRLISIQGVIKGESDKVEPSDPLIFYRKGSPNAMISNDGRTLQKKNLDGQATAVTNRLLKEGETFIVRLDERNDKSHPVGIGVTSHPPGSIEYPNHMSHLRTGNWLFYLNNVYSNNTLYSENYTKTNLKNLEAGGSVGVKRDRFGSLHLIINGVDQGPGIQVPNLIYGAFELHTGGLKGTIIS